MQNDGTLRGGSENCPAIRPWLRTAATPEGRRQDEQIYVNCMADFVDFCDERKIPVAHAIMSLLNHFVANYDSNKDKLIESGAVKDDGD